MDGAGRRAERDRDREGAAGGEGRGAERGGEDGTRGWLRERRTGGGEVSDHPWREILKEAIPFAVVLVVYFALMAAISADSIAWYLADVSASTEREAAK